MLKFCSSKLFAFKFLSHRRLPWLQNISKVLLITISSPLTLQPKSFQNSYRIVRSFTRSPRCRRVSLKRSSHMPSGSAACTRRLLGPLGWIAMEGEECLWTSKFFFVGEKALWQLILSKTAQCLILKLNELCWFW